MPGRFKSDSSTVRVDCETTYSAQMSHVSDGIGMCVFGLPATRRHFPACQKHRIMLNYGLFQGAAKQQLSSRRRLCKRRPKQVLAGHTNNRGETWQDQSASGTNAAGTQHAPMGKTGISKRAGSTGSVQGANSQALARNYLGRFCSMKQQRVLWPFGPPLPSTAHCSGPASRRASKHSGRVPATFQRISSPR